VEPPLHPRGRCLPRGCAAQQQILVASGPRGQRVGWPQPELQLHPGERLRL